jgi:UDP-N-acetylmuramoyl-tripeptide--D-alanyl-D-alanine ligase
LASLEAATAAAVAGGRLVAGDPGARLAGAAIDSRAVRGGELFFAFAGAHDDGHRFVGDAFRRGAAGAVVQDLAATAASWPPLAALAAMAETVAMPAIAAPAAETAAVPRAVAPDEPVVIQVADTFAALHALARDVRRRVPRRLIGITGSAGKTTTKELLAAMLARRFRVARSPGNFNNLYGFPLALLNVPDDAEWMVAEMGMSTAGELRQLSLLGRPDVALFTVVRPAHLASFDGLRGIAEAKAELLAGLAPDGLVIANADDPEVARIARRAVEPHPAAAPAVSAPAAGAPARRIVWYGIEAAAKGLPVDIAARDLVAGAGGLGSRFVLAAGGAECQVRLPLHGLYNVENCLAAAACAHALGVPLAEIAAAVETAAPAAGRGVVHQVRRQDGQLTVIDDSYNSNPDALGKALAAAAQLAGARRVAVLGDMLELGPEGPRFHREGGREAVRLGYGLVVGVGELARHLTDGAREAGVAAAWYPDAAAAADWAATAARPGDVVLVKGSRGIGLDRVVRRLIEPPAPDRPASDTHVLAGADLHPPVGPAGAARRGGEA